jgi:general secretion pathway protein D
VPGLGDLPVIGRLFSQTRENSVKTEIVLLITPRLVRTLARPEVRAVEFAAGTESSGGAGTFTSAAPPPPAQPQPQPQPQPTPQPAQPSGSTMMPFGGVQQPR